MTIPNAQYVVDSQGQKVFVQVPVKDWEKLIHEFKRIKSLLSFQKKLRTAFKEVGQIQRGEKEGQTLSAFLDEL